MEGSHIVYTDSITPVLDRAVLWEGGYRIDDHLTLEPAPGHTPGSSLVRLASGFEQAVFVGDMLHSPVQILEPAYNSCFCHDPQQAAETRRQVLGHAAKAGQLVIPAHFAGAGAAWIQPDADGFALTKWAPCERS